MNMTETVENERFKNGAHEYAAYLETPEGRLRTDLAFANLQDLLPRHKEITSLRALDVGCGTGAAAVRLARLGFQVKLVDSSQAMLDLAERAVEDACVRGNVTLTRGDVGELPTLFDAATFDVIVCHNLLEFVDDPTAVLRNMARTLRDSSAVISVLVRNRAGEVLKSALLGGDLAAAETNLKAEFGRESLYGGKARLFTFDSLRAMLNASALAIVAERGVRVLADYLPPGISRTTEYSGIFELERTLGAKAEYAGVARYTQCLARRAKS